MRAKPLPIHEGRGELRFLGFTGPVDYAISGEPDKLRSGPNRLRGVLTLDPETALAAFRAGHADLTLDNGAAFRLTPLGHTEGETRVFVELRV